MPLDPMRPGITRQSHFHPLILFFFLLVFEAQDILGDSRRYKKTSWLLACISSFLFCFFLLFFLTFLLLPSFYFPWSCSFNKYLWRTFMFQIEMLKIAEWTKWQILSLYILQSSTIDKNIFSMFKEHQGVSYWTKVREKSMVRNKI